MKKTINGIRYNTENATKIGEYDNLHYGADSITDFSYWTASLYVTPRSGRYFLAGEGGPMTMFSRPAGGNSTSGGSGLFPMDRDEAFAWAQRYLDEDKIEAYFGDMIEEA